MTDELEWRVVAHVVGVEDRRVPGKALRRAHRELDDRKAVEARRGGLREIDDEAATFVRESAAVATPTSVPDASATGAPERPS